MGKKGGSAPSPDPRIGEAALKQAEVGESYLEMMRGQADIANRWAAEDRKRYQRQFMPLEDRFIAEAEAHDSPARKQAAAAEAASDVSVQASLARQQQLRQAMSMGVDPTSGAFQAQAGKQAMTGALAAAGAGNMARRRVELEGDAKRAEAINLGKGMAVNPGTSLGLANGAMTSGANGAMQGYQGMGSMLNTQHQNRMQAWQAQQDSSGALFGAIGNVAGLMLSDETAKTDKKPVKRSLLKAVEQMPVEDWRYKRGQGDGAAHTGTYAQDFRRQTGRGDGRTIPVVDAIGVTMGAVKELSAKVDRLAGAPRKRQMAA